jgi:hypothetical protein
VCTLAVEKKNQGRFRHVGSDHSLASFAGPCFIACYYVCVRSVDRCLHGLCKKSETSDMRVVCAPVSGSLEADLAETCIIPKPSVKMTWDEP